MLLAPNVLTKIKKIQWTNPLKNLKGHCYACGNREEFIFKQIITDSLAKSWELSDKDRWNFDRRESLFCAHCSNSLRTRMLAKTLVQIYGNQSNSLIQLVDESDFQSLSIAEINSCGNLHQFLVRPNILYSEFESENSSVPHEDLRKLNYKDNQFDLVLTSETLEHVPDLVGSLGEVKRVLKPGGRHICTIPVMLNRRTRNCIKVTKKGTIVPLMPKSYHGEESIGFLVYRELGGDIIEIIESCGFKVALYYVYPMNDTHSYVFVCTKE
ncbi:MAG: methyltransferase domain-containing protein [Patescibacteria group bacterium]